MLSYANSSIRIKEESVSFIKKNLPDCKRSFWDVWVHCWYVEVAINNKKRIADDLYINIFNIVIFCINIYQDVFSYFLLVFYVVSLNKQKKEKNFE